MTQQPPQPLPPSPAPRAGSPVAKALWFLGFALLANAAILLFRQNTPLLFPNFIEQSALAQPAPSTPSERLLGARGIYMMPAQLGPNVFGLYLMDVDAETICMYRAEPENSRFRLVSARSFKHDRFLDDFNNAPPTPADVQKLVEQQRQREQLEKPK